MEIRNQLTLELITILQATETTPCLTGPLAYSPDGRSIACASDTAIIIWDIQTGGVAKEIKCSANNISLVWSSDGRTICTIDSEDQVTLIVHTYDVSSGAKSSPGTLQLGDKPHLWTYDGSFWVMTTGRHHHCSIDIFRVGSTLTKIRSFIFLSEAKIKSFSPTTHHISISVGPTLCILDIQTSQHLLDETGDFLTHSFSPDGSLFAASRKSGVHIWKYASGRYTLWGGFRCRSPFNSPPQFSPTLSSILGHSGDILQVWRLRGLPAAFDTLYQQSVGVSRSGSRIAIAVKQESTVTIIDLAQASPQFIDTGMAIEGLALTGNVLLVAGSRRLVAWLLVEEGVVDGVIGDRRAGSRDSIWTISRPWYLEWKFRVEGKIGVIKLSEGTLHVYHTETGEFPYPAQTPRDFRGIWDDPDHLYLDRNYLRSHNTHQWNNSPEDNWQTSRDTLREGWVKDPEGKRRLWVPVEWRTDWDPGDWYHDATTQFSRLGGRPVLIKF